jgi:hypothetical protein
MNEYGNKYGPLKEGMKSSKLETLYAKGKYKLTNFGLKFFKKTITDFFCVRPSYVYGPNQREGTLVDLLIKAFQKKTTLKMSQCSSYRDYIYVEDVAKGIVKIALEEKKIETGIYNLGSGKCIRIRDFIIILCKLIRFNKNEIEKKLKFSKLVLGDVKKTCPEFIEKYKPAPIGCVFVDLDYYSSTVDALKTFDGPDNFFLPRLLCYFDDTLGSEDELYNEFSGELAAINDFNSTHENKKISKLRCLYERKFKAGWNEMMYSYHNFAHKDYNKHISATPKQQPLSKIHQ